MERLLLALLLSCGLTSRAQTMYQATFHGEIPKLKDYVELASMAPHKRIAYLQEIRDLLVEMEKTNSDSAGTSHFKEAVAHLLQHLTIIDTAQADEPVVPKYVGGRWTCPDRYHFHGNLGTCVAITSGRYTYSTPAGRCPAGTNAVYNRDDWSGKTVLCVPEASWSQLPADRRTALEKVKTDRSAWLHSSAMYGKSEADGRRYVGSAAPDAPTRATDGPPAAAAPPAPAYTPKPGAAFTGGAGGVTCEKLMAKNYRQEKQRKELDKHLKDFGTPSCVMGGAFSGYSNNKVAKGKCDKITTFPPGGTGENVIKCDKPGETMCNPLLFCLDNGKAICKKVEAGLTWKCDADPKTKDCDPFSDDPAKKLPDGTREAWSQFREAFDAMCVPDSPFVKYYCIECQKMSQRMIALDKKYSNLQPAEVLKPGWKPSTTR